MSRSDGTKVYALPTGKIVIVTPNNNDYVPEAGAIELDGINIAIIPDGPIFKDSSIYADIPHVEVTPIYKKEGCE